MMGAWFSELYARHKELPPLRDVLEEVLGDKPPPTPEEREAATRAAARSWNAVFRAIRAQEQEAAKAAREVTDG